MVELADILAAPNFAAADWTPHCGMLAQQTAIDPRQWARLLIALLVIVVVGLVLIASVLAWGRHMRRVLRRRRGPSQMSQDAWYRKPLVPNVDDTRKNERD